ncbi:MAG: diguanylate cyclase [Arcobacteraceae bacterium]|nr:diguanylate cyclase [Arcobacteraceae bacterium]
MQVKHNILVVDDSKTISMGLKYIIEDRLGLNVYTAASMKECADLLLEHKGKFSLALLDYGLPDAPKGEVVTFVNKFKIPSLLLTGTKLEVDDEIFKNSNLIDYIIKNGSYAIDYSVGVVERFIKNSEVEVLVIDDSKTFAMKMKALCVKYNLKAIVNHSAKEALETVKQRPNIKLILVDYMMPEMNGLEFTMQLRKDFKKDEIALIALSGMSEKEIVSSFLKYGANDFLYKDFSNEEFFARVNGNLEVLELFEATQDKAKKDYLTGVFNKTYLLNAGEEVYNRAKKHKELLAVILIDIDIFQTINESYGHEAGDEAIKELSRILLENINKDSIIARLGADQFCVLFKNRPYAEIHQTFQEIIMIVENNRFKFNDLILKYTISVGVNINFSDSLEDMIDLADEALANAKHKGSNQIVINS